MSNQFDIVFHGKANFVRKVPGKWECPDQEFLISVERLILAVNILAVSGSRLIRDEIF